jgi:putative intracellular protease/amidase
MSSPFCDKKYFRLVENPVLPGPKNSCFRAENAGALFVDEKVVEDGNLVSSRQPGDLPEFIAACRVAQPGHPRRLPLGIQFKQELGISSSTVM